MTGMPTRQLTLSHAATDDSETPGTAFAGAGLGAGLNAIIDDAKGTAVKVGSGASAPALGKVLVGTGVADVDGNQQSAWDTKTQLGAGSAGTPAYSFSGDPDTGVYSVGANQVGVTAGGALRATIDSSGLTMGTNLPVKPGAISGTPVANAGYQESLVKGWVNFTQGASPTINDSFNVTSISRLGAGQHAVNWTRAFATANYAVSVSAPTAYSGTASGTPIAFPTSLGTAATAIATVVQSSSTATDGFSTVTVIACGKQ